ncbi:MAG: exosortase system-associated protein, TIGR04073 family [Candidatus Omnitrophica bacterium]|nr:exosortase system-associated protein, TIGR04073 family [Candidatus Omnitrophota bacterium]
MADVRVRRIWLVSLSLLACLTLPALAFAETTTACTTCEPMDAGKAVGKLMRGAINICTGWVEIPKRVNETSQTSGAAAGFTWGVLRGFGHGFIRTAAGLYEVVTFPFPAPPGYAPVIQPEYIFS